MKIFPDKIRIRDSAESRILSNLRFEIRVVTLKSVTAIIIKLYRWGAHPFVFSKTICVILSIFVFPITVLSKLIEFSDKLAK